MKKLISVLSIGALLSVGSMAQAPSANAGILLCPFYGTGLVLVVIGAIYESIGLIILADNDGSMNKDALTATLMDKYQGLGMSNSIASDLTRAIKEKALTTKPAADGKISINLSSEELSQALQASNVENDNPALFVQLATDLK